MTRPLESLAQRLKYAREGASLSQEQLAQASGMKQPDISKIERGLILSTTGIARIAEALAVSARWLETGDGQAPHDFRLLAGDKRRVAEIVPIYGSRGRGIDHDMSHASATVSPTTIEWGDLMNSDLLGTFQLVVRDDAMSPFLNIGDTARFSRDRPATPGKRVLIVDSDGHHYIREYRIRRGDHWQAIALNPAYDPLDSVADGLKVVAVLTGADWQ